jgi:hypothetical protein
MLSARLIATTKVKNGVIYQSCTVHWPEAAAYHVFLLCGSTSNARRQPGQPDGAAQESNRALPYRASGTLKVAAIRTRSANEPAAIFCMMLPR